MNKSITMDWNKMQAAGNSRKGRKGSAFVSRMTGRDANGERPSTSGKVRGLAFTAPCKLEKTNETVKQAKDGSFFFQSRIGGKFGKRHEISASLAQKLA